MLLHFLLIENQIKATSGEISPQPYVICIVFNPVVSNKDSVEVSFVDVYLTLAENSYLSRA